MAEKEPELYTTEDGFDIIKSFITKGDKEAVRYTAMKDGETAVNFPDEGSAISQCQRLIDKKKE